MLSAHHLSILQRRLLPLPPQIGKPMVQKKRKGTSPLGQMVLVTLIGNHLTFPIWKQVNLDQHTDYWPASLTRSIIGTLPQSWKGLKPPLSPPPDSPSSNFLKQPTGKSGGHGCCDYTPPLSTTQYTTARYKLEVNTLTNAKYIRFASLFNYAYLVHSAWNIWQNIEVLPPWSIGGGWVGLWIKACYKIASIRQSRQQCAEGNTGTINTREQCRQIQESGADKYKRVVQTNILLSLDRRL